MAYLLSPLFNDAQFDSAGDPLVGGKLYWYQAGTTTPATVYTDATGATSHANPIVLNSRGEPASPIYLDDAVSYKAVLQDADSVTIRTIDGIDGIAEPSGSITEWTAFAGAPTYVDADEFSVAGDQTAAFHVGRRVRLTLSGSTLYGTIAASTYGAATTVQVTLDSGSLDGTLSAVAYGLTADNPAVPATSGTFTPTVTATANMTSPSAYETTYTRVGNIVTATWRFSGTITTVDTITSARVSLPIASGFTSFGDCNGIAVVDNSPAGFAFAATATDDLSFNVYPSTTGVKDFYIFAQYVVK